jgi:branched-chain amino acid transport system substrate-binding protein
MPLRPLWVAAALLALAASAPASAVACPVARVYSSQPLQGPAAAEGRDLIAAERLAVEQAGRARVTYVPLDDSTAAAGGWDRDRVTANATRAAGDRCAVAYLGEYNSGASAVSLPVTNRGGLLQVSPANAAEQLTRAGTPDPGAPEKYYPTGKRTFGRVVPIERVQAAANVAVLRQRGVGAVYVVDDGTVDGRTIAGELVADAQRAGIALAGAESVDPASADVGALAARVAASGAGAMFFGGFTQRLALPLWQAVNAAAPAMLLLADDGVGDAVFAAALEPSAAAVTSVTAVPLAPSAYPPAGRRFFAAFRARYHRRPQPYAIYGYEAARLVLHLIDVAGPDRARIVAALFATRNRRSVLGTYSIDRYGDTTLADYGVYRIRAGRLTFAGVAHGG